MSTQTWKRWVLKTSDGKVMLNRFGQVQEACPVVLYRSKKAAQQMANVLPGARPVRVRVTIEEV